MFSVILRFAKSILLSAVAVCGLLSLIACSQTIPDIKNTLNIPAPIPTQNSATLAGFSQPVDVSGTCDARIKSIEISVGDAAHWVKADSVAGVGSTTTCSNKTFALKQLNLGNINSTLTGDHTQLYLRGKTSFGNTDFAIINYNLSGMSKRLQYATITNGSLQATGSNGNIIHARIKSNGVQGQKFSGATTTLHTGAGVYE